MQDGQENLQNESLLSRGLQTGEKMENIRMGYNGVKSAVGGIAFLILSIILAYVYFTNPGAQIGMLELAGGSLLASILSFLSAWLFRRRVKRGF